MTDKQMLIPLSFVVKRAFFARNHCCICNWCSTSELSVPFLVHDFIGRLDDRYPLHSSSRTSCYCYDIDWLSCVFAQQNPFAAFSSQPYSFVDNNLRICDLRILFLCICNDALDFLNKRSLCLDATYNNRMEFYNSGTLLYVNYWLARALLQIMFW